MNFIDKAEDELRKDLNKSDHLVLEMSKGWILSFLRQKLEEQRKRLKLDEVEVAVLIEQHIIRDITSKVVGGFNTLDIAKSICKIQGEKK